MFSFHPENIGEDLQFDDHILSNGLVQPPTKWEFLWCLDFGKF